MDPPSNRTSSADATLNAFGGPMRRVIVPLLMYKAAFLGDWYEALIRHERDAAVRRALLKMSHDTLRETLELIAAVREWDRIPLSDEATEQLGESLQRAILADLLILKEGSNEAVMSAAVRAPTDDLRQRLVVLADLDRIHADELRTLLGRSAIRESERRASDSDKNRPLGAHATRAGRGTLRAAVADAIQALDERGSRPARLVLSPIALRHLRDEHALGAEGTAFGLPVDVDFAWEGECWAIITTERARLSEILTMPQGERPAARGDAEAPTTGDANRDPQ